MPGAAPRKTGHRVTLTTEDREPLLDSDPGPVTLPAKPTAVIEPLAVDPANHRLRHRHPRPGLHVHPPPAGRRMTAAAWAYLGRGDL